MTQRPTWLSGQAPPVAVSGHRKFHERSREVLGWYTPTADTYGDAAGVAYRAQFVSPLFNVRPDLTDTAGPDDGVAVDVPPKTLLGYQYQYTVKISCSRAWGVFFSNDVRNGVTPLRVSAIEFGDPAQPADVYERAPGEAAGRDPKFTTNPVDVTQAFWSGNKNAGFYGVQLSWTPSGGSLYWGVALVFDIIGSGISLPSLWNGGWKITASFR